MNNFKLSIIAIWFACMLSTCIASAADDRPNVVFIFSDDHAVSAISAYRGLHANSAPTPNIDRIAREGALFQNSFCANSICGPSRACILTGKHSHKNGFMRNSKTPFDQSQFTFPKTLQKAGYQTAVIGKWHLKSKPVGFDYWEVLPGQGSYYNPVFLQMDDRKKKFEGYVTDLTTEKSLKWLENRDKDKPFFLMLSHYAVHAPLQGKPDKVRKYESVSKEAKETVQGKPAYAAMVESVDDSVGLVMQTLREQKLDENTLVIFTSDNGGFAKATDNTPLRANKGSNYEGGIRVPLIIKWPGKSKPGSVSDEPVVSTDFYPTILAATGQALRPHQHVDGQSLVPVLTGGSLDRDAIYWHYPHYNQHPQSFPSGVIRAGDWKLIEGYDSGELSLYNLADDLGETTNLAKKNPSKAEELHAKLKAWRAEAGADPMRTNPEYMGSD